MYTQISLYLHRTFNDHITHNKMDHSIELYFEFYEALFYYLWQSLFGIRFIAVGGICGKYVA